MILNKELTKKKKNEKNITKYRFYYIKLELHKIENGHFFDKPRQPMSIGMQN